MERRKKGEGADKGSDKSQTEEASDVQRGLRGGREE